MTRLAPRQPFVRADRRQTSSQEIRGMTRLAPRQPLGGARAFNDKRLDSNPHFRFSPAWLPHGHLLTLRLITVGAWKFICRERERTKS